VVEDEDEDEDADWPLLQPAAGCRTVPGAGAPPRSRELDDLEARRGTSRRAANAPHAARAGDDDLSSGTGPVDSTLLDRGGRGEGACEAPQWGGQDAQFVRGSRPVPANSRPGVLPDRINCALELDAYLAPPEFESEEEAKRVLPKEVHSTWEHDQKKSECVTSAWDPATQGWKPLDYSRWDDLQVSEASKASELVREDSSLVANMHDAEVCATVREQLRSAIDQDNEFALRRTITHAEQLQSVGLFSAHEIAEARDALAALTSRASLTTRVSAASLVEKATSAAAAATAAAAAAAERKEAERRREAGEEGGRTCVAAAGGGAREKGELPSETEREEHQQRMRLRERNARVARDMLEVLTRNGAATKQALWSQTQEDVFVYAFAPDGARGRDVHVTLKEKWIRITLHEPDSPSDGRCVSIDLSRVSALWARVDTLEY